VGAVFSPFLFAAGAAFGATSGALSLYERFQHVEVSGIGVALDIVTIAGSIVGGATAFRAIRLGSMAIAVRGATGRFLFWAGSRTALVAGVLISVDAAATIDKVLEDDKLSQAQKTSAIVRVLANLAFQGFLLALQGGDVQSARGRVGRFLGDQVARDIATETVYALDLLDDSVLRALSKAEPAELARVANAARLNPLAFNKLAAAGLPLRTLSTVSPEVLGAVSDTEVFSAGLKLLKSQESRWPAQVRDFLARELNVAPESITVERLGKPGLSSATLFSVRQGSQDLVFKVFENPAEALYEAAYLRLIREKGIPEMQAVEPRALGAVQRGGANLGSALLMERAPGADISALIDRLPVSGAARGARLQDLDKAVRSVGRGLGKLHAAFESGRPLSEAAIQDQAQLLLDKLDRPNVQKQLSPHQYQTIRTALVEDVIPGFKNAGLEATVVHGDANFRNFIVDLATGEVRTIDVQTMRYSLEGGPSRPGLADAGRFYEWIEAWPGKLQPGETETLQNAFLEEYLQAYPIDESRLQPGLRFFRINTELSALQFAENSEQVSGAIARLLQLAAKKE
jgi:hypothetical protein